MNRILATVAAMVVVSSPAAAAAFSAVQSQDSPELVGEPAPGGMRLELGAGRSLRVKLPAGAEVSALVRLGADWLAVGTAAQPDGLRRLLLVTGDAQSGRWLPAPGSLPGLLQRAGVPLVQDGELVGLAWLEGAAAGGLGVRAALWDGERWSKPEWVARPGKGSQLALSGAVLADGSWLLVWSAFDGEDDEVVAARRVDGAWEAPRRILADNGVPDITPALALTRQGAIAAWSRYDGGGYGLVRAHWDGQIWRELPGFDRAGLYPAFRGTAELPALLYFDARRSAWTALELDARGRVLRRAEATGPSTDDAPLVERDEDGVRLRASGSSQTFAAGWREQR